MRSKYWLYPLTILATALSGLCAPPVQAEDGDLFAKRIRPVLEQRCVSCHGGKKTKGSLDLTTREHLLKGGEQGAALLPGQADKSLLMQMITGAEPRMPKQEKPLTPQEIADFRQWIDAGALWPKNVTLAGGRKASVSRDWWSLRKLERPPLPTVRDQTWGRTSVDAFILAGLEARGLRPSPEADRATLIRRVTFDLHGLPPTPEAIDAFVNDKDPRAYEKLIDELLASPRYGERWGRHWLDVVHYGDTHGYDKDKRRDNAWPYRDYVIRSLNQDKPYLRFMKEQLAGDVLYPNEVDGVVATGFIAAGPWDLVGHTELREGTVDKLKARLLDRDDMLSNAISTFVSMTIHCARCHDHKFDPIPQKDYYRLQAVFAGVDRADRPYPATEHTAQRLALERERQAVGGRENALLQKIAALSSPETARLDRELQQHKQKLTELPLPRENKRSPSNGYHSAIEAKPDSTKWVQVDLGRSRPLDAIHLFPARPIDFADTPGFGFPVRFKIEISEDATFAKAETIADHTSTDFTNPKDNPYSLRLKKQRARFIRVTSNRLWKRLNDYVFALGELQADSEGKNVALGATVTALDSIEFGLWGKTKLVDGFDSRFALPDLASPALATAIQERQELYRQIAQLENERRAQFETLIDAQTRAERDRLAAERATLDTKLQTLPAAPKVYTILPHAPRPILLLHRGDVEQPGESVAAGGLSALEGLECEFKLPTPENEGQRRVALAEWIADPKNVLARRSIVNRIWHYHFGRGIVDTPNDFGRNGSLPTHTELLDWLAVEFFENGESFKKLHRLVLQSAVYRQASRPNAAFAKIDADNRYLWHMPRRRLDAESVRDAVLAVSGKLDFAMGGPGFELFRFKDDHSPIYDHSALDKINSPAGWRRTVYRFTVRSVPNPFLDCLDCADPNINTPVRNTTLTALQALALLNDPFMVAQAEFFAERLTKLSAEPEKQIEAAYKLAFGRGPDAEERATVVEYVQKHGLANACRLLFNANEFVFID